MAVLSIKEDVLIECTQNLTNCTNGAILEVFGNLASELKEKGNAAGLDYTDSVLDKCKQFQDCYNEFVATLSALRSETDAFYELGGKLNSLTAKDVNFGGGMKKSKSINPDIF